MTPRIERPGETEHRIARHDRSLTARVISRAPLLYAEGADAALDRPAHVRAASSLARIGDRLAIIQDDANFIAVLNADGGGVESITLPADRRGVRQFDDRRGNKRFKLDLEASLAIVEDGRTTLYAFGSGSSPARERVAVVTGWGAGDISVRLVAAPALYAALHAAPAFSGSDLNLEGVALQGDDLWLFGRGNGANLGDRRPVNATCTISWAGVRAHLRSPSHPILLEARRTTQYDLGAIGTVGLGFTDAMAVTSGFLYAAAAEDSPDARTDGPVAGSCLGIIASDGQARWSPLTDAAGAIFDGKVEGIAWSARDRDRITAVLDHDDPDIPAELCIIALSGPWLAPA
jgi:hypothetical protein